ncbi:MAG: TetR/AcrR family transcriptional regulator [Rhodothermales bacterium]|nr:TetR/AcrR family transcriptional regulator [Rhodothermales bacterium]
MEDLSTALTRSRNGVTDKRAALLIAATELFARNGLQSVSTAAIARKAGVANGTLFVYFETKEQLLNELYVEIVAEFVGSCKANMGLADSPKERLRAYWFGFARWYFNHRDAATVKIQCEISSVLRPEMEARKDAMEAEMIRACFPGLLERFEGTLMRYVNYAFIAGPVQVLAQMEDKGEIEITEELLEEVFERVEKVVLL